jgi:hypothetical protein
MKKFMFSAAALIVFSFAGMASNEIKEDEKLKQDECGEYADTAVGIEQDAGFMDSYEQYDAYMFYYDLCQEVGVKGALLPVVVTN